MLVKTFSSRELPRTEEWRNQRWRRGCYQPGDSH